MAIKVFKGEKVEVERMFDAEVTVLEALKGVGE